MKGYVKSSPYFFRIIKKAAATLVVVVCLAAAYLPAPLQTPADPTRVPNPVKSAWFLLWLQELVSYSRYAIYPVLALGLVFFFLPWITTGEPLDKGQWFPRDQRFISLIVVAVFLGIVTLTLIGLFCRGENWRFVAPF